MTNLTHTPKEQEVPLPPAPALPFTLKADTAQYRKSIGPFRILLALGVTAIFWVKFGPLVWLLSVIGIAVLIAIIIFMLTRRSITINNEGIHYKNSLGFTKSVRFDEVSTVEVFDNYSDPGFGTMPRIILAKKSGGYLFSIIGIFWPYEGMTKMLSSLKDNKVKMNFYIDYVQSQEVAKAFPNLVPFYERHPLWTAMILVVVLFAVVAAGVILFMM